MTGSRGKRTGGAVWSAARPVVVGTGAAIAVALALMAATSLVMVVLRSVTHSALFPLALLAAGVGCFAGAYVCACIKGSRGLPFGAVVGLVMYALILLAGLIFTEPVFGSENAVKLVVLVMCGCFGGYLGGKRAEQGGRYRR